MSGLVAVCSTAGSVLRVAVEDAETRAAIRLVVTDRPCAALGVATAAGIPAVHEPWTDRTDWSARLADHLDDAGCTDGVLFFTRLLDPPPLPRRLWNLHPSLLPLHPGQHGFEDSVAAGDPVGSTVHLVDAGMDTGPIWFQDAVDHAPTDPATLRHRLFLLQVAQLRRLAREVVGGQGGVAAHRASVAP